MSLESVAAIYPSAALLALAFGLCAGSFINTCAYRAPLGLSVISPGSMCPQCEKALGARHLIPVLSFLLQRGRCAHCGGTIGWSYPLVEIAAGLLAVVFFLGEGFSVGFFRSYGLVCVFLAVALVDARHRIVPDTFVIAGLALSFFLTPTSGVVSFWESVHGFLAGGVGFFLVREGYRRIRGQEGMGAGDVKLSAMIGAALGIAGWLEAVMIGSLIGVALALALIRSGRATSSTHFPYGTYLSLAAILVQIRSLHIG